MIELTIPIEPKPQTRPKFGRGGAYEGRRKKRELSVQLTLERAWALGA